MRDKTFGWTIEMQIKALMKNYKYKEIDVKYKKRLGKSKISGTLKGSVLAGKKILYLIFKYYFKKRLGYYGNNILTIFFIIIYSVCSLSIFFFSLIHLELYLNYKKSKTKAKNKILTNFKNLPFVTVQLPIYNEQNVIKRLLNAVVKMDYPSDKIEIQVLDDSDDNSTLRQKFNFKIKK